MAILSRGAGAPRGRGRAPTPRSGVCGGSWGRRWVHPTLTLGGAYGIIGNLQATVDDAMADAAAARADAAAAEVTAATRTAALLAARPPRPSRQPRPPRPPQRPATPPPATPRSQATAAHPSHFARPEQTQTGGAPASPAGSTTCCCCYPSRMPVGREAPPGGQGPAPQSRGERGRAAPAQGCSRRGRRGQTAEGTARAGPATQAPPSSQCGCRRWLSGCVGGAERWWTWCSGGRLCSSTPRP